MYRDRFKYVFCFDKNGHKGIYRGKLLDCFKTEIGNRIGIKC